MRRTLITFGFIAIGATVAACDTDAERGLVGAAGGAAISTATGGSAITGALIGGAAGVFCDDAGVCR